MGFAQAKDEPAPTSRRSPRSVGLVCAALAALGACIALVPAAALGATGVGAISGLVVSEAKAPIEGIEVCALTTVEPVGRTCALTAAGGEYELAGLAAGQYKVQFLVPQLPALDYLPQFYPGKASEAEAEAVTVAEEAVTKEVNATLVSGADIAGRATGPDGKPVTGIEVCALEGGEGARVRCSSTDAAGEYTLQRLPAGEYELEFAVPGGSELAYSTQFYNGVTSRSLATRVAVTAGSLTPGIDAAYPVPIAQVKPLIAGSAIEGQTLTATPGTWTNAPTSMTDEWGRCDSTGLIKSCHTIATTPTYTLTAADVGSTIRIREKAANAFGEGAPSFSRATAVVTLPVAPALPTTPPTGSPPVAIGLGSGVLSSTARVATTAQLESLLASLLAPHGKRAKIGELIKRRGYVVSFTSLAAGRLSIAWYFLPKGAHVSAAKPVLAAVGKIGTPASGASKLTVKLTARGRSLLAPGKPLKLTAKGVLAASGRPSLSATRSFTLKR